MPEQPECADETERMQSEADAQAEAAYASGRADEKRLAGHELERLRHEVERLQALLDHAEQHARNLQDGETVPDQPRDRGICGEASPLLNPTIFGGHCDLLAGHTGWHEVDGMHWGPRPDAPGSISIDDLTLRFSKQDVDAAYERGLAEGRAERANTINAMTRSAYEDGVGDGRVEGRRQATEGWERRWNIDEPVEGLLWGEAGMTNETSARTALKQSRPESRIVSRLVGPWEPDEQPEGSDR